MKYRVMLTSTASIPTRTIDLATLYEDSYIDTHPAFFEVHSREAGHRVIEFFPYVNLRQVVIVELGE